MVAAAGVACAELIGDADRIVAIEILGSTSPTVTVGDTLRLEARAVTARGELMPDTPVVWEILDTGQVGFTLDENTGLITAITAGSGRVRARVDDVRSAAITVTVTSPTTARYAALRSRSRHRSPA